MPPSKVGLVFQNDSVQLILVDYPHDEEPKPTSGKIHGFLITGALALESHAMIQKSGILKPRQYSNPSPVVDSANLQF